MKVGIIVHSHTGHTLMAAEKIRDALQFKGIDAAVLRVVAEEGKNDKKNVVLTEKPCVDSFDALIFGSPVWAFSLTPAMHAYLSQLGSLKGKRVGCFITQSGGPLLGGNRSVKQIKALSKGKGAEVILLETIRWKGERLEQRLDAAAEKFCAIVG